MDEIPYENKDEIAYLTGNVFCPECDMSMSRACWKRSSKTITCLNPDCSLFNVVFSQPRVPLSFIGKRHNPTSKEK
jgi:hypothetical protein